MNKEEILAMEAGPELDALVAERVMGWTWLPSDDENPIALVGPGAAGRRLIWYPSVGSQQELPRYSTEIAAAWEVVEKLAADGWAIVVEKDNYTTGYWYVRLGSPVMSKSPIDWPIGEPHGGGVCWVICAAALLTTLEQES